MTKELIKDILTIVFCWLVIMTGVLFFNESGYDFVRMSNNIFQLIAKGSI